MASDNGGSFQIIKRLLLKHKELFEDTDFPANEASIGKIHPSIRDLLAHIEWKRPKEILRASGINLEPLFIRDGATRADFDQGKVGDCWFIAAAACLAVTSKKLLYQIILPDEQDQSFRDEDYAGIFRFRFWRYGKWVDVIIDDRLPTVRGKLAFAHNMNEPNEFWAALMEKAYAKLHGSYFGLDGGFTKDAMVDLTGGISKWYKLNDPTGSRAAPDNLYAIMQNVVKSNCLMSCSISGKQLEWDIITKKGLYKGHAYSITDLTEIQTTQGENVKLIRLRNPWGRGEWYGDWSDRPRRPGQHISSLWDNVDDGTKKRLNFKNSDDGEFWMSYDDWLQHFEYHQMCFLSADEMIDPLALDSERTKWKTTRHFGKWEPGVNAGGGPIENHHGDRDNYWKNPQYRVHLESRGSSSPLDFGMCTMLVSLIEVDSRKREPQDIAIGVRVHREAPPQVREQWRKVVAESGYAYGREVTAHFTGGHGDYIVVPSTFEPDKEASYLLRIFTEY